MDELFSVRSEVEVDGEYVFCKVFYVLDSRFFIGDRSAWSVRGAVINSAAHLLNGLERCFLINFPSGVCAIDVFNALNMAIWEDDFNLLKKLSEECLGDVKDCVAIPVGVESFDGEMAFCARIDGEEIFVWRDYESGEILSVKINKKDVVLALKNWLNCLD